MLGSRRTEKLLRKQLRSVLRTKSKSLQKQYAKQKKTPSTLSEWVKQVGSALFIPVIFASLLSNAFDGPSRYAAISNTMPFLITLMGSVFAFCMSGIIGQAPEYLLSLFYPIHPRKAAQAGFWHGIRTCILWQLIISFSLLGLIALHGPSVSKMLVVSIFSIPLTALLILRTQKTWVLLTTPLASLVIALSAWTGVMKPTTLETLQLFTPYGWIWEAASATGIMSALWGLMCLGASLLAIGWFPQQARFYEDLCLRMPEDQDEELPMPGDYSKAEAPPIEQQDGLTKLDRWWVGATSEEHISWLTLCSNDSLRTLSSWRFSFGICCLGFALAWVPIEWVRILGLVLQVLSLLSSTPVLGGNWTGPVIEEFAFRVVHPLALYPADWRDLETSILKINLKSCVTALPCWLLVTLTAAQLTFEWKLSFQAGLCAWLTVLSYQPMAGFLSLSQGIVECTKGDWWRKPLTFIGLLVWVFCVGACALTICSLMFTRPFLYSWWMISILIVLGFGALLRRWLRKEYLGRAYDHVKHLKHSSFLG